MNGPPETSRIAPAPQGRAALSTARRTGCRCCVDPQRRGAIPIIGHRSGLARARVHGLAGALAARAVAAVRLPQLSTFALPLVISTSSDREHQASADRGAKLNAHCLGLFRAARKLPGSNRVRGYCEAQERRITPAGKGLHRFNTASDYDAAI